MKTHLIRYARAGYAGLFIVTAEEARAEAEIQAAATELNRPLHVWSVTEGFADVTTQPKNVGFARFTACTMEIIGLGMLRAS